MPIPGRYGGASDACDDGDVGARLVAASLPIYALAVAILLYSIWLTRATAVQEHSWWAYAIEIAATMVVVGGHRVGAFGRRVAVASVGYLLLMFAPYVALFTPAVTPLVVLFYYLSAWPRLIIDGALVFVYPWLYQSVARRSDAVASSLSAGAPLAVAVLLTPILVGPHYWPEWKSSSDTTVLLTTGAVAAASTVALAAGLHWPRFPPRAVSIGLAAVAIVELAWFARGLPNVPMTITGAPPLTFEYPADRPALAGDLDAFRAMVSSVVRRSGVALPPAGVYARFRWHDGGPWDDPAPPSGAIVVTLWAEHIDDPATTTKEFAHDMARFVIPANDGTVPETDHPHWGYLNWALVRDADAEPLFRTVCRQLTTNTFLGITDFDFAPYLRAEHDGGPTAARALHARWMTSPPGLREWDKMIRDSCGPPLS